MAKKESTFFNMFIALFVIAVVSSISLAYVNQITQQPRMKAQSIKQNSAMKVVVPEFDKLDEPTVMKMEEDGEEVRMTKAYKNKECVGVIVQTYSNKGFGGKISLLVGFLPDGSIYNTAVLSHAETPGLGDKMDVAKSNFPEQFKGKYPEKFKLKTKKEGGEVDAITAATISSNAFCDAVQRAYDAWQNKEVKKPAEKRMGDILPASKLMVEDTVVKGKEIYRLIKAYDEQDKLIAIAVESNSENAYKDSLLIWTSFYPNGEIYKTVAVMHHETQGFGDMIEEEKSNFTKQFTGVNPSKTKLRVKADGGSIDVYSGATITSKAYIEAVIKAYDLLVSEKLIKR